MDWTSCKVRGFGFGYRVLVLLDHLVLSFDLPFEVGDLLGESLDFGGDGGAAHPAGAEGEYLWVVCGLGLCL